MRMPRPGGNYRFEHDARGLPGCVWIDNKKGCETMKVKSTNELLKGRELNYRQKAGMQFSFKMMPGFQKTMDSILIEINESIAKFEAQNNREPTKEESETITKEIMLLRFPSLKHVANALGQGKKIKNINKLMLDWVKSALPGNKKP
jgi:hypothetical protein